MNKSGPIIIIDDDADDCMMVRDVLTKLKPQNEVVYFDDPCNAFEFIQNLVTKPFFILSDINMPVMNGLELRDKLYDSKTLSFMCVPYLFYSTSNKQNLINRVYEKPAQGFFVKPSSMQELEETLRMIIGYWSVCCLPS